MAPNRPRDISGSVMIEESDKSDDADISLEDSQQHGLSVSDSEMSSKSDDSDSSGFEHIDEALYQRWVKEYETMKHLKRKLRRSLKKKAKKSKSDSKNKDVFTRFSVTYFSKVIESLTPDRRDIISQFGFGCLLKFEKCYVPNKFAKWVAKKVDYKSGDIIVKDKLISLTKESVHSVLELRIGGRPFSSDSSHGKSLLLSKFQISSVPSVKYFGDKLIKNEPMSDEHVFICFILVALNCFLCANSSLVPSSKYLCILEDLTNAHKFDWSKLVVDWLLDSIKCFNKPKSSHAKEPQTLGGCLYYLAVMYLDFVDFGHRQLPDTIPRVEVWKNMMIKQYSDFDKIETGVYGFRPMLDVSRTCYKKNCFDENYSGSLKHNVQFREDLDSYSGCSLPQDLKDGICDLIDKHCFNSGLTINMDITALASLPNKMKLTFSSLLQHVYSVDSRTQTLVLNILKLVAQAATDDSYENAVPIEQSSPNFMTNPDSTPKEAYDQHYQNHKVSNSALNEDVNCFKANDDHVEIDEDVICTQPFSKNSLHESIPKKAAQVVSSPQLHTPNLSSKLSKSKVNSQEVENVMQKLCKNASLPSAQGPSKFVFPPSGYPPERCPSIKYNKRRSRMQKVEDYVTETEIAKLRQPLFDLTNDDDPIHDKPKKSVTFSSEQEPKDVIIIDRENIDPRQSDSPCNSPCFSRYFHSRTPLNTQDSQSQQTPMTMRSLPSSQPEEIMQASYKSPYANKQSSICRHQSPSFAKKHPEVQVLGERCLSDTVKEMCNQAEEKYDKSVSQSAVKNRTPSVNLHASASACATQVALNQHESGSSGYHHRDSSTGGKVPIYGPRRCVAPGPLHRSDFVVPKKKYIVSRSELANYKAICSLAKSKWKDENAVVIGGVRSTFMSFGESLKPGGFVMNFVVNVYCRHLFMKPNGHPDISKRHYFFSTIGDNLMKDPCDVNVEVVEKAFRRSRKARPLHNSDMLFFPTLYDNHWFVFAVDIKDRCFVFLDSYFHKDHEYQEYVRERLIPNFQVQWDIYVQLDMKFDEYETVYPDVPKQSVDNLVDSGIFALMFLEHWSPRVLLDNVFDETDIQKIRIKIANELFFLPNNSGMKSLVTGLINKEIDM